MAQNPETSHDYQDHVKTYGGFIQLTKWTIILVVIVLVLMAFFLL